MAKQDGTSAEPARENGAASSTAGGLPRSRFARRIAAVALVLGGLAVAGYFIGAAVGWWDGYQVTFHDGRPGLQRSTRDAESRPAPRLSLVVLPLLNESGQDGDWFPDSVSADLTIELGRLAGTLVISRDTAYTYKGQTVDPRDLSRDLGVRYVVRGTVRRDGDRVRLTLAMVDGETGAPHWARQFEMDRADLRRSLAEAAAQVGLSLGVTPDRAEGGRVASLTPHEVQADDLAMQGWDIFNRGLTRATLLDAQQLFDAAVARDPRSVRGWGGVAVVNHGGATRGWLPDRDAAIERFQLALRELQGLDESDPSTFLGRVGASAMTSDYEGQLMAATAMVERFPNNPNGHFYRGQALLSLGRLAECTEPGERAIRLSPRDPGLGTWNLQIATCHFMRGEYGPAAVHARRAVQANPNPPARTLLLAAALARDGSIDEARQIVAAFRERNPAYRVEDLAKGMNSKAPQFVEGRNRIEATLAGAGDCLERAVPRLRPQLSSRGSAGRIRCAAMP